MKEFFRQHGLRILAVAAAVAVALSLLTYFSSTSSVLENIADWQTLGLRFAQLRFTTESASECVRVLRAYQGEPVEAPENITRGLFYRGAE